MENLLRKKAFFFGMLLAISYLVVKPVMAWEETFEGTPDAYGNCFVGGSGCTITIHHPDPPWCPDCVNVYVKAAYDPAGGTLIAPDFYAAPGSNPDITDSITVNYSLTGRDITNDVNTYYPGTKWSTNDSTLAPPSPGH